MSIEYTTPQIEVLYIEDALAIPIQIPRQFDIVATTGNRHIVPKT
jgi:hypothetical protein